MSLSKPSELTGLDGLHTFPTDAFSHGGVPGFGYAGDGIGSGPGAGSYHWV